MTDSALLSFTCKVCNQIIEFVVPANVELLPEWQTMTTPQQVKYYKAKAMYIHNMTHKGLLNGYGIE